MIKAPLLLADLTRLLKRLEEDLLRRIDEVTELKASLKAEWQAARDADRTAETFETWVGQVITQAGVHWLLSCVFLRFIEDNKLVDRPWLGGTPESGNLALARDRHEAYFRANPLHSDREYLLASFREAGALPGLHTFFDEGHNPVFRLGISGDAAMAVRQFWQQVDPNTGALAHDFTDPTWNTRFLGDLYQDLSEATRKRYALLQTPEFVEEFILDRTLTPAIREYGYRTASLIDPTCGSGHFLLGAFHRFVDEWQRAEPSRNRRDIAQKSLDAVAGVDLNPFAVAISRFRLLVAALFASDVHKLSEAPDFRIHVAIGDSLLHGKRFGMTATEGMFEGAEHYAGTGLAHAYASEDLNNVQRILGRQYHAVVGNPPYIVVKDAALNAAYRARYFSCHKKYSLGAPFTERFFELAKTGRDDEKSGYVGLITANSFMKREFGSKLIEDVLPRLDLTHVIDTSGAYIPGHGTPTVILFGRHRAPMGDTVRTVMGIKGEPSNPQDPAHGLVWSAIVDQIDRVGSESAFISVAEMPRATFGKHPWSIGGGGATEVLELINEASSSTLGTLTASIGRTTHTGEDNAFFVPKDWILRHKLGDVSVALVEGEGVRDFLIEAETQVLFPYDKSSGELLASLPAALSRHFWRYRRLLKERSDFGNYIEDRGLKWFEHSMFFPDRYRANLGISFAEVATHNHFVLDRGGKVFKQTAPVIKLLAGSGEDVHLQLLGLLNSSVVGFWLKQVSHQKQMMGGDGIRISEKSKVPYQFASTRLQELPLPEGWASHPLKSRLAKLAGEADRLARTIGEPSAVQVIELGLASGKDIVKLWESVLDERRKARSKLIFIQEEIDFICYAMYGLAVDSQLLSTTTEWDVPIEAGSRPFCILSQQNVDGFDVPPAPPPEWPLDLRELWSRRISAIKESASLRTIEDPHYKRRWIGRQGLFNHGAKANQLHDALASWLLNRLESTKYWETSAEQPPQIMTISRLSDLVQRDEEFMKISAIYAGHSDFDVTQLLTKLIEAESVPFLPVQRYSDTGLRKIAQWQETWALQRREDAIDEDVVATEGSAWLAELTEEARKRFALPASGVLTTDAQDWLNINLAAEIKRYQDERKGHELGPIPVPPKYQSKDFIKTDYWRMRGGLDVPKERWVSYPGCERGADTSLPIAWAGWDYLQQATALASFYIEMKESEGWESARLQPLLAGLLELVPWLEQWHNEVDPVFGERMGEYYKGFVSEEARAHGFTLEDLRGWKPAVTAAKRGRKKASS